MIIYQLLEYYYQEVIEDFLLVNVFIRSLYQNPAGLGLISDFFIIFIVRLVGIGLHES